MRYTLRALAKSAGFTAPYTISKHRHSLLLVLAAIVFYSPGLLPGRVLLPLDSLCFNAPWASIPACRGVTPRNPLLSDQVFAFHPWRAVIRRDGWQAALWNPYAFAGSPMLANGQAQPLYPLTWLHFFLPATWSYVLAAILKTVCASIFTYAFARRTQSNPAAALAAIAYAFSYSFVFAIGYPISDAIIWLPALLWALAGRRHVWLGIFTALDLVAGQPESSVVVAGVVASWWIAQKPGVREIARVSAAAGAGVVVALPALIPLLRYVSVSAAGSLRENYNPMFYSFHTLLDLLTPDFFGFATSTKSWGSNPGGFYGLLPVLLTAAWIVARPRRAIGDPFLWIFVASLCCVYRVPPLAWFLALPHLRTIYNSKFWIAVTFAGAMLAARAFDEYRERCFALWWTAAFALICAVIGVWSFREFIAALHLASFEAGVALKLLLSLLASLAVLRWRPRLAPTIVFAELSLYLFGYNPATSRELLFPSTPGIEFLQRDPERFRIMGDGVLPPSTAGIFGLEDVRGYDAMTYLPYFNYMSRIDRTFPDLPARFDLAHMPSSIDRNTLLRRDRFERPAAIWGKDFTDFLHRAYYWNQALLRVDNPQLLDLLNVKYYLLTHGAPLPQGIQDYSLVYSGEMDIYRNPHVLPRVHVDGDGSRAHIVSYWPTEVTVEAQGPGVLVLADTMYPGWEAQGFSMELVEGLLRGIRLPSGNHLVRFVFHAWY